MKKVIVLLLALALIFSVAACKKAEEPAATATKAPEVKATEKPAETEAPVVEVEKPATISIMVDGTFKQAEQGQEEWVAAYEAITGVKLEVTQPDHSSYYDVLNQTIASGDIPDVLLLSSTYYSSYAQEGILADITEYWEASDVRAGFSESDLGVINGMYLDGKLYGLSQTRGNGCVTYIKQAWLDNVGMTAPTNFEEYLALCDAFTTMDPDGNGVNGDTYALAAAGLIGPDAPWIQYLPEFYQDGYPSYRKTEDGTWVDGFTQDSMLGAFERLQSAYAAGYIDPETLTYATSDVRNRFYENKTGIFTYWAGKWAENLRANLEANGLDDKLIAIPPIAEVGKYIDRATGGYCVTTYAENPEGVYKYFLEPMFDNGEVQGLWLYGVEGRHYSTAAETVLGKTYTEGQLHGIEMVSNPGTAWAFNSPMLTLGISEAFLTAYPFAEPANLAAAQVLFNNNSKVEDRLVSTDVMTQYNGDLVTLKKEILANIITQGKSIEEEMQRFIDEGGAEWSQMIVDSLNSK